MKEIIDGCAAWTVMMQCWLLEQNTLHKSWSEADQAEFEMARSPLWRRECCHETELLM